MTPLPTLGNPMQSDLAFPQSLVEKYRPLRIADFIGLERPKKVLSAFCKRPASGAWLFIGPSGLGKSTMALALAAELQAELHKIPSHATHRASRTPFADAGMRR
jgi:Holliday junction resolvasome RuvABC ATP-dependent DNA helicase subunit